MKSSTRRSTERLSRSLSCAKSTTEDSSVCISLLLTTLIRNMWICKTKSLRMLLFDASYSPILFGHNMLKSMQSSRKNSTISRMNKCSNEYCRARRKRSTWCMFAFTSQNFSHMKSKPTVSGLTRGKRLRCGSVETTTWDGKSSICKDKLLLCRHSAGLPQMEAPKTTFFPYALTMKLKNHATVHSSGKSED